MGIKTLATHTLARAIEDICPDFSTYETEQRTLKIQERIERYKDIEREYDSEWEEMEKGAERELGLLIAERNLIFDKIRDRINTERIAKKIETRQKRKERKVESLRARGAPKQEIDEVNRKFLEESSILQSQDNSQKIYDRLNHSQKVWEVKLTKLRNRYRIKETGYNIRRNQKDRVRMSLQWFVEDFERVLKLCRVAGMDVKDCYYLVRERLGEMQRASEDLDAVIERIERHEY